LSIVNLVVVRGVSEDGVEWLDEICYKKIMMSMEVKMANGNEEFSEDGELVMEKKNGMILYRKGLGFTPLLNFTLYTSCKV